MFLTGAKLGISNLAQKLIVQTTPEKGAWSQLVFSCEIPPPLAQKCGFIRRCSKAMKIGNLDILSLRMGELLAQFLRHFQYLCTSICYAHILT